MQTSRGGCTPSTSSPWLTVMRQRLQSSHLMSLNVPIPRKMLPNNPKRCGMIFILMYNILTKVLFFQFVLSTLKQCCNPQHTVALLNQWNVVVVFISTIVRVKYINFSSLRLKAVVVFNFSMIWILNLRRSKEREGEREMMEEKEKGYPQSQQVSCIMIAEVLWLSLV